ncbi:hypothetical protein P691DRAFT_631877, partial [Macrolepiota fuliginosa MF-IS2]
CWQWGHVMDVCHCLVIHCPICSGLHMQANHHSITRCCHGNPKASTPVPPTPTDMPCPHIRACINCGNQYAANDWCCPYWHHHF